MRQRPRGRARSVDRGSYRSAIELRNQRSGVPTSLTGCKASSQTALSASRRPTPRGLGTRACTQDLCARSGVFPSVATGVDGVTWEAYGKDLEAAPRRVSSKPSRRALGTEGGWLAKAVRNSCSPPAGAPGPPGARAIPLRLLVSMFGGASAPGVLGTRTTLKIARWRVCARRITVPVGRQSRGELDRYGPLLEAKVLDIQPRLPHVGSLVNGIGAGACPKA